jgi:hypothetical protein
MDLGARQDWEVEINSRILFLMSQTISGLEIYSVFFWSRVARLHLQVHHLHT